MDLYLMVYHLNYWLYDFAKSYHLWY